MKFYKYSANGNDFVLLENAPSKSPESLRTLIQKLCHRKNGIGADGLIFLWKNKGQKQHQWRFFNRDGSETNLCGNAARAVGDFLRHKSASKKEWQWQGNLGVFRAKKYKKTVQVQWPLQSTQLTQVSPSIEETLSGFNDRGLAFSAVLQVGVPHLVLINYEVWSPQDRFANNAYLRTHADFGHEGSNVTWLSLKDQSCVTFERGVEEETLACGSGALAAFLAYQEFEKRFHSKNVSEYTFQFPGGPLRVSQEKEGFWISGLVQLSFEGKTHDI